MGQRSIGLLEVEEGKYNAHYCHWTPQEINEDMFSEDTPLGGVFRENAEAENIEEGEIKEFCRSRPESIAIIISQDYDIEILDREDLRN